jgi:probable HAF family extracellular repeat protein
MNKIACRFAIALGYVAMPFASAAPAGYTLTPLSPLEVPSRFTHINSAGVIAGYTVGESVLRYPDGTLTILPRLNDRQPTITALGNDHSVGLMYTDPGNPNRILQGAIWRNGVVENLPLLRTIPDGRGYSVIASINNTGAMSGSSATDNQFFDEYGQPVPIAHAISYVNGQLQDLGTLGGMWSAGSAINNLGHIVGVSGTADDGRQSFIYRDGTMQALSLDPIFSAFDINDAGQVLANSNNGEEAVIWENGQLTSLTKEGYRYPVAAALNNHGDVVGRMWREGGFRPEGFIYSEGELTLLTSLIDEPGWTISEVQDINDAGTIVALGCFSVAFECTYVQLTPVPEPSTTAMMTLGIATTMLAVRRARRVAKRLALPGRFRPAWFWSSIRLPQGPKIDHSQSRIWGIDEPGRPEKPCAERHRSA